MAADEEATVSDVVRPDTEELPPDYIPPHFPEPRPVYPPFPRPRRDLRPDIYERARARGNDRAPDLDDEDGDYWHGEDDHTGKEVTVEVDHVERPDVERLT